MATMRTSAFSVVHSVVGEIHSSWASEANWKNEAMASSGDICRIGSPPARSTSSYTASTSGSAAVVPCTTHTSPSFTLVEYLTRICASASARWSLTLPALLFWPMTIGGTAAD